MSIASACSEQIASGSRFGVRATPTFFVNGVLVDVSFGIERLQVAVDALLAGTLTSTSARPHARPRRG